MVLCHYTAGPLQAGLNGDPVVVRYYLTDDSAKPAGASTAVPKSIFTTYGAKFKRFEDAVSYKGYNFTGWSINKNLGLATEYINSSTSAWVKQSSSTIRYLTSAGDYRIGEHNSSSAYTLYGAEQCRFATAISAHQCHFLPGGNGKFRLIVQHLTPDGQ